MSSTEVKLHDISICMHVKLGLIVAYIDANARGTGFS